MKEQPRTRVTHFRNSNFKHKMNFKSCKNLCMKNVTYTKKFYEHEIAAINLSKIYFLKNTKKTYKPNSRYLNRN